MKTWSAFFRENLWLLVPGGYLLKTERTNKLREERREKILEAGTFLREFIRADGRERIRIFRCPDDTFGAVLESCRGEAGWISETLIGPGAVFDSVDAAESRAAEDYPWIKKMPNQTLSQGAQAPGADLKR